MTSLTTRPTLRLEIKEFLKLAIPLSSAQVAQAATGFVDTIMMGHLGAETLAAGGLAATLFYVLMTAVTGTVMGASPLVAQAFGAGQTPRIRQIAGQALWLALMMSIPVMVLTAHLGTWLGHAGQSETTVVLVSRYLSIILWGLFPAAGFGALRATASALSEARPVMVIVVLGTVFNILGNYSLGFGKFGLPRLELAGLAVSSMLTLWGMFIAMGLYVCLHPRLKTYRLFAGLQRLKPRTLRRLIWVGLPIGVFSALESGFFMVIMFWMGLLGTEILAAHLIVFQTIIIVFMVPMGVSYAATVRVGQWLGRGSIEGVRRAIAVSASASVLFMTIPSALFLLFPTGIVSLFLDVSDPGNAEIVAIAKPLLMIGATVQIFDGFQKAIYGALQGLQDTQVPTLLNILGFWGVGLSVGYVLGFGLGLGGPGLWLGQSSAIAVVAFLFTHRLWRLTQRLQPPPATATVMNGTVEALPDTGCRTAPLP
ncbi:MAG: MATE family efflux transporter [Cyanobacteria bacterium J06627_15]